jgi:hypothetical protein
MKQIIPLLVVVVAFVFFLALRAVKPPGAGKPGILRRVWRMIVRVWDFITDFG